MALASKSKRKTISPAVFLAKERLQKANHEAMNLAALWEVPVLFVCENNLYAMGTAIRYPFSDPN
jgi:TPP-dependent pyruvate/acetoin dehydrogenase alpha subunit